MKRWFAIAFALLCLARIQAAPNAGFGLDAFNRAVSASVRGNAVFSPFSFEIDSVIFSEAVDVLTRAKLAESMGVLNGLENVYSPLYVKMTTADSTKSSFLDARGFCIADERKINPVYRLWLQRTFSAEMFSDTFRKGAECWFRSRLDGDMESFSFPHDVVADGFYSYYDLVVVHFPWKDPFPTNNTRKIDFKVSQDKTTTLQAFSDLRNCDIWECKNYSALRLQMTEETFFFALLPKANVEIRDLRGELSSNKLNDLVYGFNSITELGLSHEPAVIVIPKIDFVFEADLQLPFDYFQFPTQGMERMQKGLKPRYLRQRVRFVMDERGCGGAVIAEKPSDAVINLTDNTKRFFLNKPFLFFIYHVPTAAIPVVGQFMGQ